MNSASPLAALRVRLGPALAQAAVFDGWGEAAIDSAATAEKVDPALAHLAFAGAEHRPAGLAMALVSAWIDATDAAMIAAFPPGALADIPIRERLRRLVRSRLEAIAGAPEALRRALAVMALPGNVPAALRRGWHSADLMWRLAGDTATDYNHYSKRATLAALYAATLAVFADDASPGHTETWAFLDRRIEGVMRFEKAKARLLGTATPKQPTDVRGWFSPVRALGWLRYPAP